MRTPRLEATSVDGWPGLRLLILALACSEFTIPFVIGIVVELCWRDRSPRRAYVWVVPLVLYAIWWLGYHQSSNAADNLTAAPAFAADLAASAIGGLFGLSIDWGRPLLVGVPLRRLAADPRGPTPRLFALTSRRPCSGCSSRWAGLSSASPRPLATSIPARC